MTPRNDMVCLDVRNSYEDNIQIILKNSYTRYPCCEGSKDNILGLVHIRDVLSTSLLENTNLSSTQNLRKILKEMLIVPESASISQILIKMNKQQMHTALVVDEYGGTSGLLTIDDIIEEIMGDLYDRHDLKREGIKQLDENTFECNGMVDLESVEEVLGVKFDQDYEQVTLGGYVFSLLERLPEVGDVVGDAHCIFEVLDMDKARIQKAQIDEERHLVWFKERKMAQNQVLRWALLVGLLGDVALGDSLDQPTDFDTLQALKASPQIFSTHPSLISLKQAWDMVLSNYEGIKAQDYAQKKAKKLSTAAKLSFLPEIDLSAFYVHLGKPIELQPFSASKRAQIQEGARGLENSLKAPLAHMPPPLNGLGNVIGGAIAQGTSGLMGLLSEPFFVF
ncbi:Hemolysins and related proteins containing CBS domains [Helicobacter bizzozeronii CCUG 35545]|nr:Hemolysins and related proteins containing CBS domains [Helicobacter bizzozeronii CCUG 35545]